MTFHPIPRRTAEHGHWESQTVLTDIGIGIHAVRVPDDTTGHFNQEMKITMAERPERPDYNALWKKCNTILYGPGTLDDKIVLLRRLHAYGQPLRSQQIIDAAIAHAAKVHKRQSP